VIGLNTLSREYGSSWRAALGRLLRPGGHDSLPGPATPRT